MTQISCQNIALFEGTFVGVEAPSPDYDSQLFKLCFTSFVKIKDDIHNPISVGFLVGDNLNFKADQSTVLALQPLLKVGKLYRLVASFDAWSISNKSGVYYRLIDLKQIDISDSLLAPYVGKLDEQNSIVSRATSDLQLSHV